MIDALTTPLSWPGFGGVSLLALLALCAAALLAGLVDAIVGGGGLVQLSALLVVMPGGQAIFSVATNKLASVVGTASVTVRVTGTVSLRYSVRYWVWYCVTGTCSVTVSMTVW